MTELEVRARRGARAEDRAVCALRLDPSAVAGEARPLRRHGGGLAQRLAPDLGPPQHARRDAPCARGAGRSRPGAHGASASRSPRRSSPASWSGRRRSPTSRAGGPLYAPRLALEELTLPTDPSRGSMPSWPAPRRGSRRSPRPRRGAMTAPWTPPCAPTRRRSSTSTRRPANPPAGQRDAVILHQAVLRTSSCAFRSRHRAGSRSHQQQLGRDRPARRRVGPARPAAGRTGQRWQPECGRREPQPGRWRGRQPDDRWRWQPERRGRRRRRRWGQGRRRRRWWRRWGRRRWGQWRRRRWRQPERRCRQRWGRQRRRGQRRRRQVAQARRVQGTPRPGRGPERLTATTRRDPPWCMGRQPADICQRRPRRATTLVP